MATTTTPSRPCGGRGLLLLLFSGYTAGQHQQKLRLSTAPAASGLFDHCDPSNFALPPQLGLAYASAFGGPPGTVPGPPLETFATVAVMKGGWAPGIRLYETPIAVRFVRLIDALDWNCVAAYSGGWRDALTGGEPVVRAPEVQEVDGEELELHASGVRQLCMARAWTAVVEDWMPEALALVEGALSGLGYDNLGYGYDAEVDAFFDIAGGGAVADVDGLTALAAERCFSPQVMGAIVGRQVTEYARRDGYNMYGDLNRDGTPCRSNCRRYMDPTNYYPVQSKSKSRKIHWKPLEEDNGRGYTVRQDHVTPHIGTLAKTAFLSRADVDAWMAPKPNYKYDQESRAVAERLRRTALNLNNEKELIEFFDDKLAVTLKVIEAVAAHGTSFEQILNYIVGVTASEYDATLVAWKEKVRHDLVRPTTWIRDQLPDEEFETYGGPGRGALPVLGKNFDAWVRVMPHSEYVSGSGCICRAIEEYTDGWMEGTDGALAPPGAAPATHVPGASIAVPLATDAPGGREAPFLAGSSRTEPGMTPAANVTIVIESMAALRDACGDSRLDGGMHFAKSVPAAYDLCSGIGTQGVDYALGLLGTSGW